MPGVYDSINRLRQRLNAECRRASEVRSRMEDLAGNYREYVDLQEELEARREKIRVLIGVLADPDEEHVRHRDLKKLINEHLDPFINLEELRKDLTLWEAIQWFLQTAGRVTIGDIEYFLEANGFYDVSRQAIESALKTHRNAVQVNYEGRKKFISLKPPRTAR
jgi:hypothetical protein